MLASRHVRLDGSVLTKTAGEDRVWNSCALFDTDKGDIEYSVRLIKSTDPAGVAAMIGFAPSDVNVDHDRLWTSRGYYIYLRSLNLYAQDGVQAVSSGLGFEGLRVGQTLRLRFAVSPVPSISAALEGAGTGFKHMSFPSIAPGDYRPCILLLSTDTALEVSVDIVPRGPDPKRARSMLKEMWQDTSFSDCRVVCGDKVLQCHRVVLAAASPVWRTALESSFREGQEATICIEDAKGPEVEALVKYAYKGQFDDANAAALLPLAHRYEMPDLLGRCGQLMLKNLSVSSVASTVSAINTFREHEDVAPLWPKLVEKVCSDPELREAAMSHVRP